MEKLANEIIEFLKENQLWRDVSLYYDNKRVSSNNGIEYGINVSDYIEYNNPETITMSFEGPLYHVLNDFEGNDLYFAFENIVKKYGFYFEFGYAWSLALYKL
jgi:hypothetical protein